MNQNHSKRFFARIFIALLCLCTFMTAFAFDKVTYANADPNKYYVEVDLVNNIVNIFQQDKNGKYTIIAKQFPCTTGAKATPTPVGTFKLNDSRRRFGFFRKFDVYGQYWTHVVGGIYFHSLLYTKPQEGYMTRTSFNNLGNSVSHGCIRLLVEDARWMYYNLPAGTEGVFTDKKVKDSAATKKLLPTFSFSQYKVSGDQYEAMKRGLPKATLKRDSQFKSTSGKVYTAKEGDTVYVMSSGKKNCRVKYNNVEGHINTLDLNFIYNGPKDQDFNLTKSIPNLVIPGKKTPTVTATKTQNVAYYISSSSAVLYKSPSTESEELDVYGKDTDLEYISKTNYFYKVKVDGKTGFVLKEDVKTKNVDANYKGTKVVKIKKEEPIVDVDDSNEDLTSGSESELDVDNSENEYGIDFLG